MQPTGKASRLGVRCAHRGGRVDTPENTMAAFRHSCKWADSVELDVRLTRDRRVIVLHDATFARTCGGAEGHVEETDYADLPSVVASPSEGYLQGVAKKDAHPDHQDLDVDAATDDEADEVDEGAEHRIPLFSEVLDLLCEDDDMKILVEFKQNSELLATMVSKMLAERDMIAQGRVAWFALGDETNRMLGRANPTIPRAPSVKDIAIYMAVYNLGLLDLARLPFCSYNIAIFNERETMWAINQIPLLRHMPHVVKQGVASRALSAVSAPGLFAAMRERGLETWVLGVNRTEHVRFAQNLDADTVFTDRPRWLAKQDM